MVPTFKNLGNTFLAALVRAVTKSGKNLSLTGPSENGRGKEKEATAGFEDLSWGWPF